MAHTVSGQLRKATFTKQLDNGGSMFVVELSEYMKDKDQQPVYTNYKAAFFPKSQAAYDHLSKALVEGNFIVVTCDKLKIDVSPCGQYTKLDMQFPKLDDYFSANQQGQQNQPAQQSAPRQQGGFQQQSAQQQQGGFQQQAPMQQQGGFAPQQQAPQQGGMQNATMGK